MIETLAEIAELFQISFWHTAFVFLRVGALVSVLPAFGERSVPARVKLIVALSFTLIVSPAVPPFLVAPELTVVSTYAITETIIGLAIGLSIRLFVLGLQTAGAIAAQSTSLSQLLGGAAADPLPAMGYVLVVGGLALAMMTGLHLRVIEAVVYSYDIFPAGQFPAASILTEWGVSRVAEAFTLAFTLSSPFLVASLIYNVALGVINKAMPQLMVAFVGAPAITLGGMILLFLTAPILLSVWVTAMNDFLANPFTGTP
jgi:flagellar biosynthetic protein FliR